MIEWLECQILGKITMDFIGLKDTAWKDDEVSMFLFSFFCIYFKVKGQIHDRYCIEDG